MDTPTYTYVHYFANVSVEFSSIVSFSFYSGVEKYRDDKLVAILFLLDSSED